MKRPSFQWYPSDWLSDSNLRACSIAARGLWMDMLCLMHQGEPYGYLTVSSKVVLPPILARMVGASIGEVEGWLEELESVGVFSRTEEGAIYSRRMIRDEEIRQSRANGGIKSLQNPNVPKPKQAKGHPSEQQERYPQRVSLDPSPSSSSSSSSSEESKPSNEGLDNLPTKSRKAAKPQTPKDSRSQHWAIETIRSLSGYYPKKILWDEIIQTLGDEPRVEQLTECFRAWAKTGQFVGNTTWYLGWFVNGIPQNNNGGHGRASANRLSVAEQNAANSAIALKRTLERMRNE